MSIKPIIPATLDWQDNTPFSRQFDDIYFSKNNGLAESSYVFLQQNQLEQRFKTLAQSHFTIAETGFGTGLNFLNTWQLWKQHRQAGQKLFFISVELYPLSKTDLQQCLSPWQTLAELSNKLIANYPPLLQGQHCIELDDSVTLILIFDDVIQGFNQLLENSHPNLAYAPQRAVDAWFLDGFAPQQNQGMWSDEVFQLMAKLSKTSTTLATFTAAGFVKRGLQHAGFRTEKVKGYGNKREMLRAEFIGLPTATQDCTSHKRPNRYQAFWPIYRSEQKIRSVIVIGAGIAGCSTAKLLAEAGLQVTLIDSHNKPMQAASGNPQAVLFPRLSLDDSTFAQFNLFSYLYAARYYQQAEFRSAFHPVGLLQLINERINPAMHGLAIGDLMRYVSAREASQLANTELQHDAFLYPQSGWLDTQQLADYFAHSSLYQFYGQQTAEKIYFSDQQWHVQCQNQQFHADAVVICNAYAAKQLLNLTLPCKNTRGQISGFNGAVVPNINTIISYDGYICPSVQQQYVCGATFDLHNDNPQAELTSDAENLALLAQYLPDFEVIKTADINFQRVNFRCATPDYLPFTGPVANEADFNNTYRFYKDNAKAMIPEIGSYQPGLFINIGFGSRGFSTAPLCAAIIRSYIMQQAYPAPFSCVSALNPARYVIRQITGSYSP